MKIDARQKSQDFTHPCGKRIYCNKEGLGSYGVGMNGTSRHFGGLNKVQAESKIKELSAIPQNQL